MLDDDMSASRSRSHRSVFGGSWLLGRGSIVAFITLSIITSLGISDLTARSGIEPSGQSVNRILKGDRSKLAYTIRSNCRTPTSSNQYSARNSFRFEITSWLRIPG